MRPLASWCLIAIAVVAAPLRAAEPGFRAGAATSNITPPLGDEIVGGFHPFPATHIHDELHARCLVLDDGTTRLALVVCDLLGFHRSLGDEARRLIELETGIPAGNVLLCATHTHSATKALGGGRFLPVQKPLDAYQTFVARRIADGVRRAANLLRPAEAAWGTIDVPEHLFNRRWFMRPGTMPENPFGSADDLVKMNPPAGSPNLDKPAGPTDPTLPFLVVREPDGTPIGLFATYSLHYVGGVGQGHVSADYFGMACAELERLVGRQGQDPPFVAMLANGTSGDINNIDFLTPRPPRKPYEQMRLVAHDVAAKIAAAIPGLEFHRDVPLAAVYREPEIASRRPTEKELAWARATLEKPAAPDAKKTLAQIYAERVLAMQEQPATLALPLQLLSIGPARIGTMPCEVFCEIGLEFRSRCEAQPAFLVSLAHGYYGYLPTPRQIDFGGYETWPGTNRLGREASTTMLRALVDMAGGRPDGPRPAAQSVRGLEVAPGLAVELVAAEPEVIDPVAFAFDADGVLWVAEMGDYPTGPPDGGRPRSRIKRLEDRDGDGRYEHARVFADGLSFCTGLQPWRDGLIVTRAGGIDFLKDADGDGRADGPGERETWFTGFAEQNSQLRANHPVLGVDGLVSVANGLRGGTIVPADRRWQAPTDAGIDIRGHDFRFDPRGGLCEAITGPGQFGLTFDEAGTRFICSNRNPCIQVMFEDRDLRRQPALALAAAVQDASPAGERSRVHPLSRAWTTSNLHANQFSAACGVHIHRGDGLPAGYVGNAFVCEPTGNLVHRDRLELHGVTWQAVANDSGREFLASVDDWFRPVTLADGPDGCLYVADMHRAVIEHPEFMPPEIANRPDLRDGDDRGRIYRIRDAGRRIDRPRPQLSQATSGELVGLLDHPNGWHRDTAARLLLERADPEAVPALQELATHGRTAAGRIRSLWLLARLGGLESPTLQAATRDADPSVRAAALTLAGPLLATDEQLVHRLLEAATETDARVRFAVALRLGDVPQATGADATAALANLLRAAPDDRWLRAAVLSSSRGRAAALLAQLLDAPANTATALTAESAAEIAAVVGAAADEPADAVAATIEAASGVDGVAVAVLDGLCKGLDRRRVSLADLTASWPEPARTAVTTVLSSAARITADDTVAPEARLLAIRLLRQASASVAVPALLPLAAAASDQAVRSAAIATLARFDDPRIDDAMLADIQRQTSTVRRATIDASVSRPARAARLLDALDRGDLAAACLASDHWNRLVQSPQAEIRGRAEKLRTANAPEDRVRVIEAYAAAAQQPGDAVRGRAVFARVCAACHRVDGLGVNVGPDISDSRTKRPEQYLVDILDPNRAIDAGSFACTVQLADGRSLTGLIVAETGGSLTLRQQEGATVTLIRDEIEDLRTGSVSLMPVGLEKLITVPEMTDLISFLKNWRYQSTTAAAGPPAPAGSP